MDQRFLEVGSLGSLLVAALIVLVALLGTLGLWIIGGLFMFGLVLALSLGATARTADARLVGPRDDDRWVPRRN